MRHKVSLFLLLAAFWLLNSGHNTFQILSLGLLSIIFVVFIAHRMDVVDDESQPLHLTVRMPAYHLWLAKEVILANIDVVKRIWRGNSSISPVLVTLKASQKTEIGKVIYASSITLTPGTVTVNLEGGRITVHALTREAVTELRSGYMDRLVSRLED